MRSPWLKYNLRTAILPHARAVWLHRYFVTNRSRPRFGGLEYVLQYLGRYTHRVTISNHRPIFLASGQVTFRWRDSARHNQQKLMTLSLDEF